MAKLGTISYTGQSGKEYAFDVYPWETNFNEVGTVYLITKRTIKADGGGSHTKIYVGQTGDLSERFDDHHKIQCFKQHSVNCICIHVDSNEQSRISKEGDLITALDPPCNG